MSKKDLSFLDFVKDFYSSKGKRHNDIAHRRTQVDFLRNKKGDLVIENIIRLESIEADYNTFILKNKIVAQPLPHIGKLRSNLDSNKDIYCKASRKIINQYFKEDFDELGYNVLK